MALAIGKGGELNVVLRVKDDGSVTVEKFARTAEQSFSRGANAAKAMSAAYDYASGNLSALTRNIFSLKSAIAGLGVGAVGREFIEAASTAEQYRVRLNVLLGSVSEGNKLFAEMSKYAARTPFEYEEIMGAATALSGVLKGGVDEIKQWMPLIGDLAAAAGLGIQETTGQVSRMLAAGANSADLFRERGILAMLGFQAGVQVSAEETKERLMAAWTDTNSRFRGATEELSRTWEGTMSMLSDKWFMFRNQVMDAGVFDYIKAVARVVDADLGGALEGNEEAAKRWADTIIRSIETMTIGVAKFVDVMDEPVRMIGEVTSSAWDQYQKLPSWAQDIGILGALMLGPKGRLALIGTLAALDQLDVAKFEGVVTADQFVKGTPEELRAKLDQVNANLQVWREKEARSWYDWQNALPDPTAVMPSQEDLERMKVQLLAALQVAGQGAEKLPELPNLTDQLLGEGGDKKDGGSAVERVTAFFERVRVEMENARAAQAAALANDEGGFTGSSGIIVGDTDKELEKLRTALADKLYALDESFLAERDLLANDYLEKLFLLEESLDADVQSHEAYYERRAALDAWYSGQKAKLDDKDLKRTQAVENSVRSIRQATFNHGLELLNALAVHSKAAALIALALQKGLAIAETIVNTKVAQMRALAELGPIAGPPMAATIGAWGAASVALIAATGLVQAAGIIGGGGPTASPVYSADPGTSNPTTNTPGSGATQPVVATEPRIVNIVIDSDRMVTTSWVRDHLIPEINDAVGDGVVLRVST